jgi:hypothetical protein
MTRRWSLGLALGTIVVGLGVHLGAKGWDPVVRDVVGDALWAAMVYWWVGAIVPGWSMWRRAGVAIGVSWLVEASQLVHVPWLDAVRKTKLGHLVLGSGFDPRDLGAYVAGVAGAVLVEAGLRNARRPGEGSRTAPGASDP